MIAVLANAVDEAVKDIERRLRVGAGARSNARTLAAVDQSLRNGQHIAAFAGPVEAWLTTRITGRVIPLLVRQGAASKMAVSPYSIELEARIVLRQRNGVHRRRCRLRLRCRCCWLRRWLRHRNRVELAGKRQLVLLAIVAGDLLREIEFHSMSRFPLYTPTYSSL